MVDGRSWNLYTRRMSQKRGKEKKRKEKGEEKKIRSNIQRGKPHHRHHSHKDYDILPFPPPYSS
jgi:hypothetical protein